MRKKTVEISKKYPKIEYFLEEKVSSFCEIMREKTEKKKKFSITFNKFSLTIIEIWNALLVLITQ